MPPRIRNLRRLATPAGHGGASPPVGPAAAGTITPLIGPAAPATVNPLVGPADRGTMVKLMGPADPGHGHAADAPTPVIPRSDRRTDVSPGPAAAGRRTRANRARSGHRHGIPLTRT
jgi:hypothetical protein